MVFPTNGYLLDTCIGLEDTVLTFYTGFTVKKMLNDGVIKDIRGDVRDINFVRVKIPEGYTVYKCRDPFEYPRYRLVSMTKSKIVKDLEPEIIYVSHSGLFRRDNRLTRLYRDGYDPEKILTGTIPYRDRYAGKGRVRL